MTFLMPYGKANADEIFSNGDLVSMNPDGTVYRSTIADDPMIIGVCSTSPSNIIVDNDLEYPNGHIYVQVNKSTTVRCTGIVHKDELVVSAPNNCVAKMKITDKGIIVGRAINDSHDGYVEIQIVIMR